MSVLSLGLFGLAGTTSAQFNNNYYFSSSTLPNYTDVTTVKATEEVSADELITVGYALEPGSQTTHDIVIVKTKSANGGVIWAYRYGLEGLDERAYGLTLSYDQKHVIVVGSAQNKDDQTDWNGLAMKLEISTGNVVWSHQYGVIGEYQELRMIEPAFDFFVKKPLYLMVGSSSYKDAKSMIYAVGIFDDGSQLWSNVYFDGGAYPDINDYAYTMIKNPYEKFILCGTRQDNNAKPQIFTVELDATTGNLTDRYIHYTIGERPHFEGAICNISLSGDVYYGMAFSSRESGVEVGVDAVITTIVLDKTREPKVANFYWQKEHPQNFGLSIYQSTESEKLLNIYTSIYDLNGEFRPGFLNTDIPGAVNYFFKYNADQAGSKYATAMEQTSFGYTAKALHFDGNNGFMLAATDANGKTECIIEEEMLRKEVEAKFKPVDYKQMEFGKVEKRDIKVEEVHGKMETCDGQNGQSFKNSGDAVQLAGENTFRVYPNPMNADQPELRLEYSLEETQRVEISIYNALGQQTHSKVYTLPAGLNQLPLEVKTLSPGVNLLMIRKDNEVIYQHRVIME